MADPELFDRYKQEIDEAATERELLNIQIRLGREYSLESSSKYSLLALVKEKISALRASEKRKSTLSKPKKLGDKPKYRIKIN